MVADGASDISVLEWAIGIIAGLVAACAGHLHLRINRVEEDARQIITDALSRRSEDDRETWRAITLNRQAFDEFARAVVTKEDLRDFERRILAAFDARVSR